MLHANVCKVNYATRAGETVVKNLLYDINTPKGKTCALKSADKDPKLLDKPKRVWYTDKKEQRTSVRFCRFKNSSRSRVQVTFPALKNPSENIGRIFLQRIRRSVRKDGKCRAAGSSPVTSLIIKLRRYDICGAFYCLFC